MRLSIPPITVEYLDYYANRLRELGVASDLDNHLGMSLGQQYSANYVAVALLEMHCISVVLCLTQGDK